jgi:arylsulfatase A-like enzyme
MIVSDHGFEAVEPANEISGGHGRTPKSVDGIYIISGAPVRVSRRGPDLSLYDVAPTLLYLLGIPAPPYAEGRVAVDVLLREYVAGHPPRTAKARVTPERITAGESSERTPAEEERLKKLKSLGYIK